MFILFMMVYHEKIACFYLFLHSLTKLLPFVHKLLLVAIYTVLRKQERRHIEKQSLYFDGCEILRYTRLVIA